MWENEYFDNGDGLFRYLNREDDGTPPGKLGRYEIVFDFKEQRYYCFVDAINMDEALGIFFTNHNTVTYKNVIETMEI